MHKAFNIENVSEQIRQIIAQNSEFVKRVGIFGSLARGDYTDRSDVDILVEYLHDQILEMDYFVSYCGVCNDIVDGIHEFFGRKVDVVHFDGDPAETLGNPEVHEEIVWL